MSLFSYDGESELSGGKLKLLLRILLTMIQSNVEWYVDRIRKGFFVIAGRQIVME